MVFGLSFGKKGQKTSQTSTIDKTETQNQLQTGTQSSSGTTTASQTGSTTGQTSGTNLTTQSGTNKTTGTTTGTTQQTTSAFSDSVLGQIERAVGDLFGTVGGKVPISAFNANQFVESGLQAATSDINSNLEANVNQLIDNIGGTATTNSAAALLTNRLRNDAAAEVAGVRTNLTSQAEQINRENALASGQLAVQDQGFLANLLQVLKGGQTTTTGQETQQTAQDQQTQTTGSQATNEQTSQQTAQSSVQTQQLIEQLSQLLQGTSRTTGTETVNGKTSSSGGGFSLGF